jgi:hypothetical protein
VERVVDGEHPRVGKRSEAHTGAARRKAGVHGATARLTTGQIDSYVEKAQLLPAEPSGTALGSAQPARDGGWCRVLRGSGKPRLVVNTTGVPLLDVALFLHVLAPSSTDCVRR